MTSAADYYSPAQWNFYCDFCGAKRKSSDGVRSWQGNRICKEHLEVRNPQDFLKGVKDNQTVPWSRPKPSTEPSVPQCSMEGRSSIPGLASPGCAIPSRLVSPIPFAAT